MPNSNEPMSPQVRLTLLRALIWCDRSITEDERNVAWKWVEDNGPRVEEMGT